MLKQMPSRNQRPSNKAFKTKHFLQAFLLLAICIWLLNQLKHTYEKNVREVGTGMMSKVLNDPGSVKLGRKDLHHETDGTTSEVGIEDEVESMSEDNENEGGGGGGGDNEIDGRDQEKTEEEETELVVDDVIDVQDNDKEDEQEDDEVIQGQGKDHEAGGEHNNGNKGDVSNSVEKQHRSRTI